jgi:hypothetical protein
MSRENVELVLGRYPAPDVDFAQLVRDEGLWEQWAEAQAPFYDTDFRCAMYEFGSPRTYVGLDGLRAFMLDWVAPWVTYRIAIEEVMDLGQRVLLLNRDCGRREGSTEDVTGRLAVIWTVRDGKIAGCDAYQTRAEALKTVGLTE